MIPLQNNRTKLKEKFNETLKAVLPIIALVLFLCFSIAAISPGILMTFLIGAALLTAGMLLFSFGVDLSMTQMGERVGTTITKTKNAVLMGVISFVMGLIITVSEPDLQVLAGQVQSIPNSVLIFSVAGGVGLFLVLALLRMLLRVRLRALLLVSYAAVTVLAFFAPADLLAVAFDAGGVTTGPMTVPFILAFGVGISAIRNDASSQEDSFGLIALCSVGPILAVLLLSLIYRVDGASYSAAVVPGFTESVELRTLFTSALPTYLGEIARALLPILAFFCVFQVTALHLGKKSLMRMGVGLLYTYAGLVLFLTGVNVGFMPAGTYLGETLAGLPYRFLLIPVGMLIGYYIVKAEPAVYVLMKQVEELTSGAVTGAMLQRSLSIGVSVSVGLAMLRVLTGLSILYLIGPGYLLSLALSFFVPDIFTAIAFDSGGVASGPMTATFLLPLATGACLASGGNVVTDAFGVVAMVAMTPLIAIQLLGVSFRSREKRGAPRTGPAAAAAASGLSDDYEIILL